MEIVTFNVEKIPQKFRFNLKRVDDSMFYSNKRKNMERIIKKVKHIVFLNYETEECYWFIESKNEKKVFETYKYVKSKNN